MLDQLSLEIACNPIRVVRSRPGVPLCQNPGGVSSLWSDQMPSDEISTTSTGRYRDDMSPHVQSQAPERCGHPLSRFGSLDGCSSQNHHGSSLTHGTSGLDGVAY